MLRQLVSADSPEQFLAVFRNREEGGAALRPRDAGDLTAAVLSGALRLRDTLISARLILFADALRDCRNIEELVKGQDVLIVTNREGVFSNAHPDICTPVILPYRGERGLPDIRFSLLYLLGLGMLDREDTVVNVFGKPGSGQLDSIRVVHIAGELSIHTPDGSLSGFPGDIELSVFNRVIHIALELAAEGREGKPVGTIFVLGSREDVRPYITRMIANPFHGYPPEDRNILDPGMEETVKEYAKIDGAFIISGDGTIEAAGIFLSAQPVAEDMLSGLGARHAAGQGITAVSSAVAVVISESTRKVTVFRSGKKMMEF